MNTPFTTARTTVRTTVRITAFFAAAVVTTVLLGSQFGLAGRYDAEAAAVLASQPAGSPVAGAPVQRKAG